MGNSNRRSSTGNTASDVSASATDAATAAVITANNISRPITDRYRRQLLILHCFRVYTWIVSDR